MMFFCTTVSYHPRQPDASNIPAKDLRLFGNELCNIMLWTAPCGKEKCLAPSNGERQTDMDRASALAGAAVVLFKDQIVQIGAGIVTAVHGFTFFLGWQSAIAQCRPKMLPDSICPCRQKK